MTHEAIGVLILVGSFFLMMFLRMGIGIAMGLSTVVTMIYLKVPIMVVFQGMVSGTNVFTFLAVPFFIFAGEIMATGGITDRIVKLANSVVGWFHGGAAMVNVVDSMFFGGISGSPTADTASLGPIELKMMTDQGYTKDFAVALTMTTGIMGMLFPPSQNAVLYAVTAGNVSIGALLMAGIFPGILLAVVLSIYCMIMARIKKFPISECFDLRKTVKAFGGAFWGLFTIVILVLGIGLGIMTATEAAAVAVLWAIIVSLFIYKGIDLKGLRRAAHRTVKTLSIIMVLIAVSYPFGWIIAYLGIPAMITNAVLAWTSNKFLILFVLNIVLLLLGTFMSMSSTILILTPILVPVLTSLDISLVQFGIVFLLNSGMGLITPPTGGVLFVGAGISGLKMGRINRAMMPFYGLMCFVLLLITYIPEITLWLPRALGYPV